MAEQKTFHLTVSRVDTALYDSDAVSVQVPGTEGDMTLLADHAPIIASLKEGIIVITRADTTTETFDIENGTVEVRDNHVSILL